MNKTIALHFPHKPWLQYLHSISQFPGINDEIIYLFISPQDRRFFMDSINVPMIAAGVPPEIEVDGVLPESGICIKLLFSHFILVLKSIEEMVSLRLDEDEYYWEPQYNSEGDGTTDKFTIAFTSGTVFEPDQDLVESMLIPSIELPDEMMDVSLVLSFVFSILTSSKKSGGKYVTFLGNRFYLPWDSNFVYSKEMVGFDPHYSSQIPPWVASFVDSKAFWGERMGFFIDDTKFVLVAENSSGHSLDLIFPVIPVSEQEKQNIISQYNGIIESRSKNPCNPIVLYSGWHYFARALSFMPGSDGNWVQIEGKDNLLSLESKGVIPFRQEIYTQETMPLSGTVCFRGLQTILKYHPSLSLYKDSIIFDLPEMTIVYFIGDGRVEPEN